MMLLDVRAAGFVLARAVWFDWVGRGTFLRERGVEVVPGGENCLIGIGDGFFRGFQS